MIIRLFFCLSFVVTNCTAEIISTHTFDKVIEIIQEAEDEVGSKNVIGIFDIDFTLVSPTHPAAHFKAMQAHRNLIDQVRHGFNAGEKMMWDAKLIKKSDVQIVDARAPEHLKNLSNKGVHIVALTGYPYLEINGEHYGEWRLNTLKTLGYEFKNTIPNTELKELPLFMNSHSRYVDGVIFATGVKVVTNKGEALDAYLNLLEKHGNKTNFKIFVMVDDMEDYLVSVEKMLKVKFPKAKFIGVHYHAAENLETQPMNAEEIKHFYEEISKEIKALKISD